jgi:probable DNA repair protein
LWQAVIEASAAGQTLLSATASARWAAQARRLLRDWQIDPATLGARSDQADYRAFLTWLHDYDERLADNDWVDESSLGAAHESELAASGSLTLLDWFESTPAQRSLFSALERAGWDVESRAPPAVAGRAVRLQLTDPQQELVAAARWAGARLERAFPERIALVAPDAASRIDELTRVLADVLGNGPGAPAGPREVGLQYGPPLRTRPVIGAALDGIELLSPRGTFVTFSRWLRSPFFHDDAGKQTRAALVETTLRAGIASQLGFLAAYQRGGLRIHLEREAAELAAALAAGMREVRSAGRLATPTRWASAWSRSLEHLGWPTPAGALDDRGLRAWEEALAAFTQLTPVLGEITQDKAIGELGALLDRPAPHAPLPRFGVHVFDHIDRVGPGYDAVWVLGLTDQHWPERGRLNPLLPHGLQSAHGMPWAASGEAVARARASMDRLLRRTGEIVCSWPANAHECSTEPSPLILAIEPAVERDLWLAAGRSSISVPSRPTEFIEDPAPAFDGPDIDGGVRALNLQARCPVRAFCETRLHARALEPPARGLNPRAQGVALHRALELFVRGHPSRESMRASIEGSMPAHRECAEQALAEVFGAARAPLAALFEIERDRIAALMDAYLREEVRRPPFTALKLEERTHVSVGQWTIQCRIDRVDQLTEGGLVLLDYKTGRSAGSASDWFSERLRDTQLPLYALEAGPALTGLMMVVITHEGISYRGVANAPDRVAGTLRPLPKNRSWTEQIAIWRTQIRQLVDEYAGGDTRLFPHDCADAQGAYAPLTRVYGCVAMPTREPQS